MKKFLFIAGLLSLPIIAFVARSDTFTNGLLAPRIPLGDSVYQQLIIIRRVTGQTNIPVAQFVTNYLAVTLNDAGNSNINYIRATAASMLSTLQDENKILQCYNILTSP